MMKSTVVMSSGSSVKAMPGLSFTPASSLILPASTSKPAVGRCRGDTAECERESDVAETGDADGFVLWSVSHLKPPISSFNL